MDSRRTAGYGTWTSPITADWVASHVVRLGSLAWDGDELYWSESRPFEEGKTALVKWSVSQPPSDVIRSPYSVRSRVHEYGGGAFWLGYGAIYFSNDVDRRLYRCVRGSDPQALTAPMAMRYADGVVDPARGRVLCVREDHTEQALADHGEPVNTIVAIDIESGDQRVLVQGDDFYAAPRLSPDGQRLAWISWCHPNMPWDGTELWVAEVSEDGLCHHPRRVAGGEAESISQPTWSPDGTLTFLSDRTGWWNLYQWRDGETQCLKEMEAEFGRPQWVLGLATYAHLSPERIVCVFTQQARDRLGVLEVRTGELHVFDLPYTSIGHVAVGPVGVAFRGAGPAHPSAIVLLDPASGTFQVLRQAFASELEEGTLSFGIPISFPTSDGETAHGFFYRPRNNAYQGPPDERPPLLVISHGGPTGATTDALDLRIQYWTSRGFAVLDVNYRGSSGYGRAYRECLRGRWGVVDVDDCVYGARALIERGEVDPSRLIIRGGSAGGYTTLCALTFRRVFHAGASYYGVSDPEALARDTHKFESRYLDGLIGPYPERRDLYLARSPIHHVDRLSCPVIFFQGLEDRVVPPSQTERMVNALREKGIPVACLLFEGEQHGFRQEEHIRRSLEAELYFYGRIFGFTPAPPIEAVPIDNLP